MSDHQPKVNESELHAFIDGELAAERVEAVERYLAADPSEALRLQRYQEYGDLIRRLYGPLLNRPLPLERFPLFYLPAIDPGARQPSLRSRMLAAAASILIIAAAVAGWFGRELIEPPAPGAEPLLVDAVQAHRVYTAERRHPVEVWADGSEHLVTWLSARLERELTLPDLRRFGLALVGGRLLPGKDAPVAQLMYEDESSRRLTLYVRPTQDESTTEVAFEAAGDLAAASWQQAGTAYALIGPLPQARLGALAEAIRADLSS